MDELSGLYVLDVLAYNYGHYHRYFTDQVIPSCSGSDAGFRELLLQLAVTWRKLMCDGSTIWYLRRLPGDYYSCFSKGRVHNLRFYS